MNELTIDIPETDVRMSHKQKQQLNQFLEKKRTTLISVQNNLPKSATASAEFAYE